MHRECRERFSRHRLQRNWLDSDPGMHHGTCVTHVPWCMSGSLTGGGGENVPGIPGTCATRTFMYLVRGPWSVTHPSIPYCFNTLRPRQNGRRCTGDILKRIFLNEYRCILIRISLKVVLEDPIDNYPALVLIMACRLFGAKPLSEPMMIKPTDAYIRHSVTLNFNNGFTYGPGFWQDDVQCHENDRHKTLPYSAIFVC